MEWSNGLLRENRTDSRSLCGISAQEHLATKQILNEPDQRKFMCKSCKTSVWYFDVVVHGCSSNTHSKTGTISPAMS